jgi:hypothetical protein
MRAIRLRVCVCMHLFAAFLTWICIAACVCGVQTNLLFISSAVWEIERDAMMDLLLLCGVCFYCISSSRISISLVNIIILCAIVCSRRWHLRPTKQLSHSSNGSAHPSLLRRRRSLRRRLYVCEIIICSVHLQTHARPSAGKFNTFCLRGVVLKGWIYGLWFSE